MAIISIRDGEWAPLAFDASRFTTPPPAGEEKT
jgi:hypothetical protein